MNAIKISVVTTVLNDRAGMAKLLASLVGQEAPFEVVVVDAGSTDGTLDTVRNHSSKLDLKLIEKAGPRGEGFGAACEAATGDVLAFIGADDYAARGWLKSLRKAFHSKDVTVVVGRNVLEGEGPKVERVAWIVEGQDISHPGCNTSYRATSYRAIGGIDSHFVTAEDMDLNYRAVLAGHKITELPDAVVHRTVRTGGKLLNQAYWNGYGRGQLVAKHGPIRGMKSGIFRSLTKAWNIPRLAAGYLGYRKGRRSFP